MADWVGTVATAAKERHKVRRRYIAIRQCPCFQGSIIFSHWGDAQRVLTQARNSGVDGDNSSPVIYRDCASLQEAEQFLEGAAASSLSQRPIVARPSVAAASTITASPAENESHRTTQSTKKRGPEGLEKKSSKKRPKATDDSASSQSLTTSMEEQWDPMICLLQEYKSEMGHCNFQLSNNDAESMKKYDGLKAYAEHLRRLKTASQHQDDLAARPPTNQQPLHHCTPSFLTIHRIQQLDNLGFVWTETVGADTDVPSEIHRDDISFQSMLHEFQRVTVEHKEPLSKHPKLQEWVRKMRNEYKAMKGKKTTTMTTERVARLVKASFTFDVQGKKTWDERAVEWLEYKTKNGGNDPKRYDKSGLGKWVYIQRAKYRQNQEGKKTNLTEKQVRQLTNWGFIWEFKIKMPRKRTKSTPWEHRFAELCLYKEEHGHCKVPQQYPVLGQWVHSQRNHYRALVHGKQSSLSKERLQKLTSIGFDFGRERQTDARKAAEALVAVDEIVEEENDYNEGEVEDEDNSHPADEAEEDDTHDLPPTGTLPLALQQQFYHLQPSETLQGRHAAI